MKIGFIGLGNMAKAMIGGMLQEGIVEREDVVGSARTEETLERIEEEFHIATFKDNRQVAEEADVIVLAVKPLFLHEVIGEIRDAVTKDKLIISIAAGKNMEWLEGVFGKKIRLIRCMPNTPALVGAGCTAVCCNDLAGSEDERLCLDLMESFGKAIVIPERLMDVAGAVGGSSPAFAFMFIEAMADGAVQAGMPRAQAYQFEIPWIVHSSFLSPSILFKSFVCVPYKMVL